MNRACNDKGELVSVIVPIYNMEKYLVKCLDSIRNQTYEKLQIILVNDGSTDRSKELCEEICRNDTRIEYYEKVNGGLSSARNYGLDYVKGAYLCFVDSDDYVEPNYIEVMYWNRVNYGADLSICGYAEKQEDEIICQTTGNIEVYKKEKGLEQLLEFNCFRGYVWNKLFCTKIIQKNKLRFCETISVWEDVLFCTQYMMHSEKIVYNPVNLYNYLYHGKSLSHSTGDIKAKYSVIQSQKMIKKIIPKEYTKVLQMLNTRIIISAINICRNYKEKKDRWYLNEVKRILRECKKQSRNKIGRKNNFLFYLTCLSPRFTSFAYRIVHK